MKKIALITAFAIVTVNLFAKEYKSSEKCVRFIKKQENCSLKAYWDCNGYSIGYGHHTNVKANDVITIREANAFLKKDIKEAEKHVNYLLKKLPYEYRFTQCFIDGFVSFVYNVGIGNAEASTFYNRLKKCRTNNGKINQNDYDFTLAAIKTSCISCNGHKRRRAMEYELMRGIV